jgi:hypothetical protein
MNDHFFTRKSSGGHQAKRRKEEKRIKDFVHLDERIATGINIIQEAVPWGR